MALTPEEAAAIVARAAALDSEPLHDEAGLDESVLRDAAREVGLSEDAVEQAVAEFRRGELAALPPLAPRRLGLTAEVVVEHPVPLDATATAAAVEAWLRGQWFEPRRAHGTTRDWAPRSGLLARARRAADVGKHLRLADASRVRVELLAGSGATTRVRVTADLGDLRRGLLAGGVAFPGVAVAGGVGTVLAITAGAPELLLGLPAGAAAGGAGWVGSRRVLARRSTRLHEEIEVALAGLAVAQPRPSWLPPGVALPKGLSEGVQRWTKKLGG